LRESYPAFYLSLQADQCPERDRQGGERISHSRKVLVVFQFTFAIILIISTVIIYKQIGYSQERIWAIIKPPGLCIYQGRDRKELSFYQRGAAQKRGDHQSYPDNSPITDIWNNDDSMNGPGKIKDPLCVCQIPNGQGFIQTMD